MKVLITGVLGFIGSYLAKYLIETTPDIEVVGVGRHSTDKHRRRLENLWAEPRFTMVYRDFYRDNVSELFEGVDYVFHLGAKTFVDHSVIDPKPFIESNVLGTWNLLKIARKYPIKKFILMSTDEVYGPIATGSWKENAPLNPTNPYSASKACADLIAMTYYKTYGVPVIIPRAENVYGPYQHPQKVIPAWTKRALNNQPLLIYGDGKHKRRWLHVEDCCRALIHIMEHGKVGEIYHIAGEEELENKQLAIKILQILGKYPDIVEDTKNLGTDDIAKVTLKDLNLIKFIPDKDIRPFHDRRYALDVSKLKSLGWKPVFNLESGLKNTVEWFKNNMWWLS